MTDITFYRSDPPPYRRTSRAVSESGGGGGGIKSEERLAFDTLLPRQAMRIEADSYQHATTMAYRLRAAARDKKWRIKTCTEGHVLTIWRDR